MTAKRRPADAEPAPTTTTTVDNLDPKRPGRQNAAYAAGLRRRRAAARRLAPLPCGCVDPDFGCDCDEPEPLSQRDVAAWAGAARFLVGHGFTPVVPVRVLRALWRRGGDDRRLAELLHDACGGVLA